MLKLIPTKNLILGVDPGLTGALALYDFHAKKLKAVIDTPTLKVKKTNGKETRIVDITCLSDFIKSFAALICGAVIEEVGAAPGQGVSSTFKFGMVTGIVHGVVAAHHIPIHLSKPPVWKAIMGLNQDKKLSCRIAAKTFPELEHSFKRGMDDGRAEAALLAKFGERIFGGT